MTDQRFSFDATVDERGGFNPAQANAIRARLQRWTGKRVLVTVTKWRERRSLKANAYLWIVYGYIAEWSGHDADEIHEALKAKFLQSREFVTPHGEALAAPGSTAALDSFDFAEYVSKVKLWAAENGCTVPEPGDAEVSL